MKQASARHYFMLLFLALLWGSSFFLMKRGLKDELGNSVLTPTQVSAIRLSVAALVLIPFAFKNLKSLNASDWKWIAVVGIFGTGIPAYLFPIAQTFLDSSIAGILNALTPLFTLLITLIFFHTPLQGRQIGGVLLGLVGAVLLISLKGISNLDNLGFSLLIILATMGYGTSVNVVRNKLSHIKALQTTALTIIIASLPGSVYLLLSDTYHTIQSTPAGIGSFGYVCILGVAGTALANITYYWLAVQTGALFAASVTYLMPLVAIGWGLTDGESISWKQIGCAVLILAGVWMVNYKKTPKNR